MELLAQDLPSGYQYYPFNSLTIKPMAFAQILEYMENVPTSPVEKFIFDYKYVLLDDKNIDNLLLCDLDYVIFRKKLLTINKDVKFDIATRCPECGSNLKTEFKLSQIKFNKLSKKLLDGIRVEFEGSYHDVRMPNVKLFMKTFSKYKRYKRAADLNVIKLVALFEGATNPKLPIPHIYEEKISNANYQDIATLTILDNLYYKLVDSFICTCEECKYNFDRLKYLKMESIIAQNELDKDERIKELEESEYKGVMISMNDLIINFFRDVVENNRPTEAQIAFREASEDE